MPAATKPTPVHLGPVPVIRLVDCIDITTPMATSTQTPIPTAALLSMLDTKAPALSPVLNGAQRASRGALKPHGARYSRPGRLAQSRRCDAQCSAIEITGAVLVAVAAFLGGCALFTAAVWRWLLLAAALSSGLAAMAVGINAEWLAALDVSVETWLEAHRSRRWLVDAAEVFRFVGQPVHVVGAAVVCGTLLSLRARSAIPGVLVVGGVGFGVVVERALKAIVRRTSTAVAELQGLRDLLHFEHVFPSGHVTVTAALLGMIAVCLAVGRSHAVKVVLAVPAVAGVLLVAFVAVYIKAAHTLTDVIGGMLLGWAIVSLGAAVLSGTHYSRRDSSAAPADAPSPSYT